MTGRGYMDVNRISGYIPGKMVFFLMQARRNTNKTPGPVLLQGPHMVPPCTLYRKGSGRCSWPHTLTYPSFGQTFAVQGLFGVARLYYLCIRPPAQP